MATDGRVEVIIDGRAYWLSGADPDHTRRLARKVDDTINRFVDRMPGSDKYQLAILAALYLADEVATIEAEYSAFRSRAGAAVERITGVVEATIAEDDPSPEPAKEVDPSDVRDPHRPVPEDRPR